ncbi:MAG TPA: hypothetical protein VJT13_06205 [Xanthobacteraceae bacterium]|nr:hypothetical protein [Xanthobacteraceae bacterium]
MTTRRLLASLAGAAAFSFSVAHAQPVRQVGISVQPYYEAARAPGGTPRVAVGRSFDGLASNKREDIVTIRDRIVKEPKLVTPMTLMVLAIRLYDVGLRDDAVFWFYAAKDRFLTLDQVVDVGAGGLAQVEDAIRNFSTLAGPIINGYAFCDIANQQAIRAKALDWVEQNPYEAIFMERLPAKQSNRRQALVEAIATLRASAAKESAYLKDAANATKFRADRARNRVDEKYCWKS